MMKRVLAPAILVALLSWSGSAAQAADASQCKDGASGDEGVAACTAYIDSGNFKGWDLAAGLLYRSIALAGLGKLDEAAADLQRAMNLRSPYPEALMAQAKLKVLLQRRTDAQNVAAGNPADCNKDAESEVALSACTSVIEKGGADNAALTSAYLYRGMANADLSKYDEALADLNKAIELEPKSGEGYRGRALLNWKFNKPDAVLADANMGVELEPKKALPYFFRARYCYETKNDWKNAIADLEKAVKLEPDNADYQAYLDDAKQRSKQK